MGGLLEHLKPYLLKAAQGVAGRYVGKGDRQAQDELTDELLQVANLHLLEIQVWRRFKDKGDGRTRLPAYCLLVARQRWEEYATRWRSPVVVPVTAVKAAKELRRARLAAEKAPGEASATALAAADTERAREAGAVLDAPHGGREGLEPVRYHAARQAEPDASLALKAALRRALAVLPAGMARLARALLGLPPARPAGAPEQFDLPGVEWDPPWPAARVRKVLRLAGAALVAAREAVLAALRVALGPEMTLGVI